MFYGDGETVIFRSGDPRHQRGPSRRGKRAPEPEYEERRAAPAPSLGQVLNERMAHLEARLERLEAQLEQARQAAAPPAPPAGGGGRRSRGGQGGEVKVSLHAEGGAQATVGTVRMISEE